MLTGFWPVIPDHRAAPTAMTVSTSESGPVIAQLGDGMPTYHFEYFRVSCLMMQYKVVKNNSEGPYRSPGTLCKGMPDFVAKGLGQDLTRP